MNMKTKWRSKSWNTFDKSWDGWKYILHSAYLTALGNEVNKNLVFFYCFGTIRYAWATLAKTTSGSLFRLASICNFNILQFSSIENSIWNIHSQLLNFHFHFEIFSPAYFLKDTSNILEAHMTCSWIHITKIHDFDLSMFESWRPIMHQSYELMVI